jgi:TRAP-type C4-dicarboxylate transport system permease small subunit
MRLALLLPFILLTAPQNQHTNKPTQQHNTKEQVQPPAVAQEVADPSRSDASPITDFHTYYSNEENGNETVKIIFDALLVIFTGGLVYVGWKQARILHKHEEWMQKHDAKLGQLAEAANKNAQAVINAERPIVAITGELEEKRLWAVYAVNFGRTPAEIVSVSVGQRAVRNIQELPPDPEFDSEDFPVINLLIPTTREAKDPPHIGLMPREDFDDFIVKERPKVCAFYFRVIYRNILNKTDPITEYVSKKCFLYFEHLGGSMVVGGPPKYNEYSEYQLKSSQ